ncbi:hypothetical protein HPB47_020858 [Ixodes persulcatus]|uniref:Uncharacterized protein n=1 Tax=Ixodes persulcatus TaxID=34615 RepID=A0AC60QGE2_IXOPE|nr:hypothetical protein HPB47_020858 [Ixodes persulcatus]
MRRRARKSLMSHHMLSSFKTLMDQSNVFTKCLHSGLGSNTHSIMSTRARHKACSSSTAITLSRSLVSLSPPAGATLNGHSSHSSAFSVVAADASFADFVDFLLRTDEFLHDCRDSDQAVDMPRRRCRDRLNLLEHFNHWEFLCLPLETSESSSGLPLSPMLQLLVALRFYGAGTFHVVTGDLVNVSQPTVCRVIERVSRVLADTLFPRLVDFPEGDCNEYMRDFYKIGKFPSVTGCIDCTHVKIKGPGGPNGEVYRNRKGFFSLNVQYKAERSALIITSCTALHNLVRLRKEPCPPALPSPPVPRRRKRLRPHVLPSPPAPVDRINGSRTRTRIISLCFQ